MKPPSEDHDLIRWLDGEMNATENALFEERFKHEPELAKEARELRALSTNIRNHLPVEMKVPHADFFNSQIQVRIAQMETDDARSRVKAPQNWGLLARWLRQPWFAMAGAAALVVLSLTLLRPNASAPDQSSILSSYTPNIKVHAHTFNDEAADATVLLLEGLEAVPADRKVSGISVHRTETDPEVAATTLYDSTGGRMLMISRDVTGNPMIWTKKPRG